MQARLSWGAFLLANWKKVQDYEPWFVSFLLASVMGEMWLALHEYSYGWLQCTASINWVKEQGWLFVKLGITCRIFCLQKYKKLQFFFSWRKAFWKPAAILQPSNIYEMLNFSQRNWVKAWSNFEAKNLYAASTP